MANISFLLDVQTHRIKHAVVLKKQYMNCIDNLLGLGLLPGQKYCKP